jgi:phage gpG-like protein
MELRIEQTGEETVIRRLRGMEERAANLAPIFEKLAADFYRFEGDVFRTEGAVNASGQWKPLSPRYAAWKAKRYPGRRILRLTGKLRSSLVKPGAEGNIEEITPTSMTLGTSIPYAGFHQRGTRRMPARKVIDLPNRMMTRWARMTEEYLMGKR